MTLRQFYEVKRRRMLDKYFVYLGIRPDGGWLKKHGDRVLLPREIDCLNRLARQPRETPAVRKHSGA